MTTPIWLTDEDADIVGYKRAKIPFSATQPNRSDCPSLVRMVTATAAGAATVGMVRTVGSKQYTLGWITDPLDAPNLTAGVWELHAWAKESNVAANTGVQVEVIRFASVEGATVVSAVSSELGLTIADTALTTGAATAVQLALGDRLVIRLSVADAGGTMAAGYNVTLAYNGMYARSEGDTYVVCPDALATPNDLPDDDILAVRTLLRDQGQMSTQLEDDEIIRFFKQALVSYSVDRPRQVAYYYSGNGTVYDFPLPPKWIWGSSRIIAVEYPADAEIPSILDSIDWEIREGILGSQPIRFLRFRTSVPDDGTDNAWIMYTTKHEYSSEYTTIPQEDADAVLWLAGSYCASALASRGAGATDSTVSADAINYRDMEARWGSVAKRLKEMYLNRVVHPAAATPVGTTVQWRPVLGTGQDFLWHSRRVRRVR